MRAVTRRIFSAERCAQACADQQISPTVPFSPCPSTARGPWVVRGGHCVGFSLPTAPPHGPRLPRCAPGSAVASVNNSIRFNVACTEPHLFLWGCICPSVTGLLCPLCVKIRKPNWPCSIRCRLFQRAPRKWSLLGLPDLTSSSELIREPNLLPRQCATASHSVHGCRALPGFGRLPSNGAAAVLNGD